MFGARDDLHVENGRTAQIRKVIATLRDEHPSGDTEKLVAAHPELMPELGRELKKLFLIESAWRRANASPQGTGLILRCPQCRTSKCIDAVTTNAETVCDSCGTHLRLASEDVTDRLGKAGKRIAKFDLVECLGQGGFGHVWKAHDTELDRMVAIKIPHRGALTGGESDWLWREARTAAQLRHPNIVRVHEVGRDEDSLFIVSDLVEGVALSDWQGVSDVSYAELAFLCAELAGALHHAHAAGVIHRDLKPPNVIIDNEGRPHLTDFGLARRTDGEVTVTVDGQVLGTPAYMSPEQARGDSHQADGRSDVYSLGVILFELLTGELPFRGNARMMIHQVLHDDPPSPRKLNQSVPKALETICLKCLEKDPRKRYAAAQDMRADLLRFRRNEPIHAQPICRIERTWRWCRRNSLAAAAIAFVVFLAVAASLIAVNRAKLLEANRKSSLESSLHRSVSDANLVPLLLAEGDLGRAGRLVRQHAPQDGEGNIEWKWLSQICRSDEEAKYEMPGCVLCIAASASGELIAAVCGDAPSTGDDMLPGEIPPEATTSVIVRHTNSEKLQRLGPASRSATCLLLSPTGEALVIGYADGSLELRSGQRLEHSRLLPSEHTGAITTMDSSPTSDLMATGGSDGRVMIWQWTDDDVVVKRTANAGCQVFAMKFSGDGATLAAGGRPSGLRVLELTGSTTFRTVETRSSWIRALTFSPDNNEIAYVGYQDTHVAGVDIRTGIEQAIGRHQNAVSSLAFLPDDNTLVSGSVDKSIRRWNTELKQADGILKGHLGAVRHVLVADGMLYSGSDDGTVRRWPTTTITDFDRYPQPNWVRAACLASNGATLVVAMLDGTLRIVDLATGATLREAKCDGAMSLAIHPTNDSIIVGTRLGYMEFWNPSLTKRKSVQAHDGTVFRIVMAESGEYFASAVYEWARELPGQVTIWNGRTLKPAVKFEANEVGVSTMSLTPNGTTLIAGGSDGMVRFYRVPTGELISELPVPVGKIFASAVSPDGATLAVGVNSKILRWELHSKARLSSLTANAGIVECAIFSDDGQTLVAGYMNGNIKLWNMPTGRELMTLHAHDRFVQSITISPDEKFLISAGADKSIGIWPPRRHRDR